MKWDNTQQWINTSKCLYSIALAYCSTPRPTVSMKDRETTYKLLCSMNPEGVVDELETFLTCNKERDRKIYDVWANKLKGELVYLCTLDNFLSNGDKLEEKCKALWNEYRIVEKENVSDFLFMMAISLEYRFKRLQSLIESLTRTYGLSNDTDFIVGLIRKMPEESDMDEKQSVIKRSKSISFSDIIQYDDKERLLKRLHVLIDGRRGADVGCVILRALQENYITRLPTQKEYESEFKRIGSWTAIHNYMNDKNLNALDRANKIVFFQLKKG